MSDKNTQELGIEPCYRHTSGRNLMEFAFQPDHEVISFQVEMLRENKIPGILSSESMRLDETIRLSYDITSLIPLNKVLERKELDRNSFLHFLRQIVQVIERIDEYLLDREGILFDCRYIFVSPDDLRLSFTYLPIKRPCFKLESLKNMLLDLIVNKIRFINEAADNYIQKLIELLKAEELDAGKLKEYIKKMDSTNRFIPVSSVEQEQKVNNFSTTIEKQSYRPSSMSAQAKSSSDAAPMQKEVQVNETKLPQQILKTARSSKRDSNLNVTATDVIRIKKTVYPQKSYIILGSVIAAVVILGIALSFTETLSPGNPDFLLSLVGYLMIAGALTYLVYSKLFTPDKKMEKTYEKKLKVLQNKVKKPSSQNDFMASVAIPKKNYDSSERQTEGIQPASYPNQAATRDNSTNTVSAGVEYVNKSFKVHEKMPVSNVITAKKEASATYDDRTVLLDAGTKNVSLKRLFGNSYETVLIDKFPFMIGRLKEQVDYCLDNPAVGKMHAEITKKDVKYYISDMNTRNGTLLNGERLEPAKEYVLENGSRITLANEEFIFEEPKQSV